MKILVCTNLSIPELARTIPGWAHVRIPGVEFALDPNEGFMPDAIVSMGVGVMEQTFEVIARYPQVPLYCYNWDCYGWVWTRPRPNEYDYHRYGELLKRATAVWVPSECTRQRTQQWWALDSKVILSSCPWWEHDNVRDDSYALCTLRAIPDEWCGEFELACKEIGIPYRTPNHELSHEEYRNVVAGCRFLVSHYHEASTGGLTLLEGYYHGKPCLLSDSKWQGGQDYLGDRATYFRFGDEQHFRQQLHEMYHSPPEVPADCKAWVQTTYSDARMVREIVEAIDANTR